MNAFIRLWNILATIADSLTRTNELIVLANARAEESLGLAEKTLKFVGAVPADAEPAPADDKEPAAKPRKRAA